MPIWSGETQAARLRPFVKSLTPSLVFRPRPDDVQALFRCDGSRASSAILSRKPQYEMALWICRAELAGKPVCELLGGPICRPLEKFIEVPSALSLRAERPPSPRLWLSALSRREMKSAWILKKIWRAFPPAVGRRRGLSRSRDANGGLDRKSLRLRRSLNSNVSAVNAIEQTAPPRDLRGSARLRKRNSLFRSCWMRQSSR